MTEKLATYSTTYTDADLADEVSILLRDDNNQPPSDDARAVALLLGVYCGRPVSDALESASLKTPSEVVNELLTLRLACDRLLLSF